MLAGQRIALRSLDIASIAAGGGSIASVDAGGTLARRPGKRGLGAGAGLLRQWREAATVTDANIVLGYLDAGAFMGGSARSMPRRRKPPSTGSPRRSGFRGWRPRPASTA